MAATILGWVAIWAVGGTATLVWLCAMPDADTSAVWGRKRVATGELILASVFWPVSAPVLTIGYRLHWRRQRRRQRQR